MSFPDSGPALRDMLDVREDGSLETNLQRLVEAHGDRSWRGGWSAPRWFAEGDILLFYLSKRALPRIKQLFSDVFEQSGLHALVGDSADPKVLDRAIASLDDTWRPIVEMFGYEHRLANELQGTIFGCARVSSRPQANASDEERERAKHWRSPVYAEIRDMYVFAVPLPATQFTKHVTLSTGGGFTPVQDAAFRALRDALARENRLPRYLERAVAGGVGFRGVSRRNWRERICTQDAPRFLDESQVRAYFADFLLADLKDPRTPLFEECRCAIQAPAPIADYFVRVGGQWLPVEAKLNVGTEPRLMTQVRRYLGTTRFVPLKGRAAGVPKDASGVQLGLVVDAAGVYLVDRLGFVGCSADRPLLSRVEIGRIGGESLRARMLDRLSWIPARRV